MYTFEDASHEGDAHRKGRGKCAERIAMDTLPIGMMVRFPKGAAPDGSIRAWGHIVGKERGIKFSVYDKGDTWLVIARGNT